MAADDLYRLGMDEKTLFDLASIYETRGSNLRAAWLGGVVTCSENVPVTGRQPVPVAYQKSPVTSTFALSVVVPEVSRGSNVPGLEEAMQVRTSGQAPVFICGSGPSGRSVRFREGLR